MIDARFALRTLCAIAIALVYLESPAAAAQVEITYSVAARGVSPQAAALLAATADQAYADPRGWSLWGRVLFKHVASGGQFTLWLAAPDAMTTFSSECSPRWSCTVGRDVVINESRFANGSPYWIGDLAQYRIMVVNHETGHWLGFDHATCPMGGALGPVMMQQSKGPYPCLPNPWPIASERITAARILGVSGVN
jgi:hypothetical protein